MEKNKKVWIRGDIKRHHEVINKLLSLGATNNEPCTVGGALANNIYFINNANKIISQSLSSDFAKIIMEEYTEIKLDPIVTPEFSFEPFDKVMVRDDQEDDEEGEWHIDLFDKVTLNREGEKEYWTIDSGPYDMCIPYNDKTKCLKDTMKPFLASMLETEEEPSDLLFNVILLKPEDSKYFDQTLLVVTTVKETLGIGLKEAKELVDRVPSVIKTRVSKKEAEVIKKAIEETEARVKIELTDEIQ